MVTLHDRGNIVMTLERTMEEDRNDEEKFVKILVFKFSFLITNDLTEYRTSVLWHGRPDC
jgi:hypothetical protein